MIIWLLSTIKRNVFLNFLSYFFLLVFILPVWAGEAVKGTPLNHNPRKQSHVSVITSSWDTSICKGQSIQLVAKYSSQNQVIDIDGNVYKTAKIGNQWWMAENLKVTHYANGEVLPNVQSNPDWLNLSSGAWCYYDNNESYNNTYGKLYNGFAVNDLRGIAPKGWHVPNSEEWHVLFAQYGDITTAGGAVKETGTELWASPNSGATNVSGFNARPAGLRSNSGGGGDFSRLGLDTWLFFKTNQVGFFGLLNVNEKFNAINGVGYWNYFDNFTGGSIRCIKDDTTNLFRNYTYSWSTGETTPTIHVNPQVTTTYYLNLSDGQTNYLDTFVVRVDDPGGFNPFKDTTYFCNGSTYLDAGNGFAVYNWSTHQSTQGIQLTSPGLYFVTVNKGTCSEASDSTVAIFEKLEILQADTTICKGETILLTANSFSGDQFQYPNQSSSSTLLNDLELWYPFDGNYLDYSGKGNHGSNQGTILTSDANGIANHAAVFDANQLTSVEIPNQLFGQSSSVSELTFNIIFNIPSLPPSGKAYTLFSKDSFWRAIFLQIIEDGSISIGGSIPYQYWGTSSVAGVVQANKTYSLAVVIKDGVTKFYLDGVVVANRSSSTLNPDFSYYAAGNSNGRIFVGRSMPVSGDWHHPFNGVISDFKIFRRGLSETEIQQLVPGNTTFLWSNGSDKNSIAVTPNITSSYVVYSLKNENCRDTTTIHVVSMPNLNPFEDSIRVCGSSYVLHAGDEFVSYLWSNGSNLKNIDINQDGFYKVVATSTEGCQMQDSTYVSFIAAKLSVKDTVVCKDAPLQLSVISAKGNQYHQGIVENLTDAIAVFPLNSSMNNSTGIINNGSGVNLTEGMDEFGVPGNAYEFNGFNSYIELGNLSGFNPQKGLSLNIGFKWNGPNGTTDHQYLMLFAQNGPGNASIAVLDNGTLMANLLTCNCSQDTPLVAKIEKGVWYDVVLTYDNDKGLLQLFLNGRLTSQTFKSTKDYYAINNSNSRIGNYHFNSHYFNGSIQYASIFNRPLIQNEILALNSSEKYLWSTGDTTNKIVTTPNSNTQIAVSVSNNIFSCWDTATIHVQDLSAMNFFSDTLIIDSLPVNLVAPVGFASYSWNDGVSLSSNMAEHPGLYKVTVSSNFGCSIADSTRLYVRPSIRKIHRLLPIDSLNNSATSSFRVFFNKPISGIDLLDFQLITSGNLLGSFTSMSPLTDSTFDITISNLTGTGSLRLDLKSSGTSIKDLDGIDLLGGYSNGQSYWIDRDAPETSIQLKPNLLTNSGTANFLFRSNESSVRYELSFDGGAYVLLPDSSKAYTGLSAGIHSISVRAIDVAGNVDLTPATWTWKIDLTPPVVSSINRQLPLDSVTSASSLTWRVRFSEPVTGVDTADFSLTSVSPAVGKLSGIVKVSDSLYDVTATVSNNTGGSLRLDLKAAVTGIADAATNMIASGFTNGQKYTLSNVSIKCPANITVAAATGRCNQTVAFTGTNAVMVTGVTSPVITYSPASGSAFNVGTTLVTATVKTGTTTIGTCSFTVTVTDAQLPTVSALTVSPVMLAPADHTMKVINLTYTATDNCTTLNSVVTVSSNEADAGTGDGDLANDIVIVNNKQVQLRAEKTPGSTARVYTITLTVKDAAGNTVVKTAQVRVAHEIKTPKSGSCYAPNSTVNFGGEYWDGAGLTHTATWMADATTIAGTDVEPKQGTSTENGGTTTTAPVNGTVAGSYKFTTAGVYKMKMNLKDNKNVTTTADLSNNIGELVVIYGNTGVFSYGGGCMEIPAGSLVAKPTVSGKASFGFTVSGTTATTGKGEVQLEFRNGAWEFNTTTINNYTINGAKLTMSGTGKVTGVATTYNYTLTAIDGNHPLGGGTDKVRLRVTTTAGAVIFDNNPGALATADPSMGVCVGLGQVYVPGGAAVGALETPREAISFEQEKLPLTLKVSPNPSTYSFRIAIGGGSKEPLKMRLTDVMGRLVEERRGLLPNSLIEIGQQLKPGSYLAEFYQGAERVVVKLVKTD